MLNLIIYQVTILQNKQSQVDMMEKLILGDILQYQVQKVGQHGKRFKEVELSTPPFYFLHSYWAFLGIEVNMIILMQRL